jgi:hypothetical protein
VSVFYLYATFGEPMDATPVLMYHSVSRVARGPLRSLAVPASLLREQLVALTSSGYRSTTGTPISSPPA